MAFKIPPHWRLYKRIGGKRVKAPKGRKSKKFTETLKDLCWQGAEERLPKQNRCPTCGRPVKRELMYARGWAGAWLLKCRPRNDDDTEHVCHISWPTQPGPPDALLREIEAQRDRDNAPGGLPLDPAVEQQIREDAMLAEQLASAEEADAQAHTDAKQAPFSNAGNRGQRGEPSRTSKGKAVAVRDETDDELSEDASDDEGSGSDRDINDIDSLDRAVEQQIRADAMLAELLASVEEAEAQAHTDAKQAPFSDAGHRGQRGESSQTSKGKAVAVCDETGDEMSEDASTDEGSEYDRDVIDIDSDSDAQSWADLTGADEDHVDHSSDTEIVEVDRDGAPLMKDVDDDLPDLEDIVEVDRYGNPLIDGDDGTNVDAEDLRIRDEEFEAMAQAPEEDEHDDEDPDESAMRRAHDLWRCEFDLHLHRQDVYALFIDQKVDLAELFEHHANGLWPMFLWSESSASPHVLRVMLSGPGELRLQDIRYCSASARGSLSYPSYEVWSHAEEGWAPVEDGRVRVDCRFPAIVLRSTAAVTCGDLGKVLAAVRNVAIQDPLERERHEFSAFAEERRIARRQRKSDQVVVVLWGKYGRTVCPMYLARDRQLALRRLSPPHVVIDDLSYEIWDFYRNKWVLTAATNSLAVGWATHTLLIRSPGYGDLPSFGLELQALNSSFTH